MPRPNSCPGCGRPSPPNVAFCASCGSHLFGSSASGGKGWKLLLGAVALFAGLLWVSVLYTLRSSPTRLADATQPQSLLSTSSGAPQVAQTAPSPSLTLTAAQHLSEAKRALAEGYKPNKDPQKTQWGEVGAAKWHLRSIKPTAPEYQEAQELLKEVSRRERQVELAKKQAAKEEGGDSTAEADAAAGDGNSSEPLPARATTSSSAYAAPSSPTATRESTSSSTSGVSGGSSSDYYTNGRGVEVHRPVYSPSGSPAGATAQCGDGTYSFSQSRRGTCSHHGGVARWL